MLWKIFLSRHTLRTHQTTCAGQPYLALDGASGKEPAHQCRSDVRDTGWIPRLQRSPGGRHGNPLQHSCLENPHGQKSLVGYSPCCHKEFDMTATKHSTVNLNIHMSYNFIPEFNSLNKVFQSFTCAPKHME